MLTRRSLLGTALAVAPALLVLSACASHPDASTLASDTQFAADAFAAFVADVTTFGIKIDQRVVDQVNKLASDVVANAAGIASALDQGDVLNKIAGWVTLAGSLLQPYYAQAPALAAAFNQTLKLLLDVAARYGFTLTKAAAVAA
jgi:hypothetical protein